MYRPSRNLKLVWNITIKPELLPVYTMHVAPVIDNLDTSKVANDPASNK